MYTSKMHDSVPSKINYGLYYVVVFQYTNYSRCVFEKLVKIIYYFYFSRGQLYKF